MVRVLFLALLSGCGLPAAEELYGLWANVDGDTVRAWSFAETIDAAGLESQFDVFELYNYVEGEDPAVIQRGSYAIKRTALVSADNKERTAVVQHILWSVNDEEIGATYGNELIRASGSKLVFYSQSADSGKRVFEAVDALP